MTYRFAVRGNFKCDRWVKEQREAIAHRKAQDKKANPDPGVGSEEPEYSGYVEFPIAEYRYTIYGGGRPSNECESWLLRMLRVEILDALRDAERELVAGGEQRLLFRVLRQSSDSRYTDIKRLIFGDLNNVIDNLPHSLRSRLMFSNYSYACRLIPQVRTTPLDFNLSLPMQPSS